MTKKRLEARVEALEKELSEMKNTMLNLAMRPSGFIVTQPLTWPQPPVISPWQPSYPSQPIITYSTDQSRQNYGGIQ